MTLNINDTQHNKTVIMMSDIMLSVIMHNAIILNIIIMGVIECRGALNPDTAGTWDLYFKTNCSSNVIS